MSASISCSLHARARGAHGGDVRLGGDLGGPAQHVDLVGRFDEPHLVQGDARVAQPHRRAAAAPLGRAQPARAAARPRRRAPARARTDSESPPRPATISASLSSSSATGKAASAPKSRTAPSTPARRPVQVSSRGVARTDEQHERRGVPGPQQHHRARLGESGQVQDVAVLAELVVRVAVAQPLGRRGQQQRARGPSRSHQLGAALRVEDAGASRRHRNDGVRA